MPTFPAAVVMPSAPEAYATVTATALVNRTPLPENSTMDRPAPPLKPNLQPLYEERVAAREWSRALVLVERQHRLEHLLHLMGIHGVEALLPAIGEVWQDSESVYADGEDWAWIWIRVTRTYRGRPRKTAKRVMTPKERAVFDALPDDIVIYRGYCGEGGEQGLSWTLDREKASWFARRFACHDDAQMIATMTIRKSDAIAFFEREDEIVIDGLRVDVERRVIIERLADERSPAA